MNFLKEKFWYIFTQNKHNKYNDAYRKKKTAGSIDPAVWKTTHEKEYKQENCLI